MKVHPVMLPASRVDSSGARMDRSHTANDVRSARGQLSAGAFELRETNPDVGVPITTPRPGRYEARAQRS
jgi:hypothetical protein